MITRYLEARNLFVCLYYSYPSSTILYEDKSFMTFFGSSRVARIGFLFLGLGLMVDANSATTITFERLAKTIATALLLLDADLIIKPF